MTFPVRFSANIRFVSKQQLFQLVEEDKRIRKWEYKPIEIETVIEKFCLKNVDHTFGALMCNIVGIQNAQQVTLPHIHPDTVYVLKTRKEKADFTVLQAIETGLKQANDALRKQTSPIGGIILGGEREHLFSFQYFQFMRKVLDRLKIPYSYFWGQPQTGFKASDVVGRPQQNTWWVRAHELEQDFLTFDEINAHYSKIQIAPGDRVFIQDQDVTDQLRRKVQLVS